MEGEDSKKKSPVNDILPWNKPDFLVEVIEEKKKEKLEILELVEGLSIEDVPDELKPLLKKPKKEELIKDDEDELSF